MIVQQLGNQKLVLTKKYKPDGLIKKIKVRLVTKWFSQQYGVNYHKTCALVVGLE